MTQRPTIYPRKLIRSAGAIVWRAVGAAAEARPGTPLSAADLEVLLVHRPRYRDWSWPKGKAELNEPLAQTAVREVEEETGCPVILHSPMTTQRYRLGSGQTKEVHYWAARLLGDGESRAARPPVVLAPSKEIDETRWVTPGKARQILTRRGDRRLLSELVAMAEQGNLDSSTVVLLRHAKAISRAQWAGNEADRPLTRLGAVQALDLVPLLSAFGVDHLVSSPWVRTLQTIAPYASITRLPLEEHDFLTEEGIEADSSLSGALVRSLMEKESGTHLVSLHRPGYEALLEPLAADRGVPRFPALVAPRPGLRTGEMIVAHVAHAGGRPTVLDIERHVTFTKLVLG